MLKVAPATTSRAEQAALTKRTQSIVNMADYPGRILMARQQWKLLRSPKWLKNLRSKLSDSCGRSGRCMYCEDSHADEIEHRRPKKLYPDDTFLWANWLYACGECNGAHVKGDRFAVIVQNQCVEVSRSDDGPVVPPQAGLDALLDLRTEDPMNFIWLDKDAPHRTVREEMKRQRSYYPELDALFTAAPEALDW